MNKPICSSKDGKYQLFVKVLKEPWWSRIVFCFATLFKMSMNVNIEWEVYKKEKRE